MCRTASNSKTRPWIGRSAGLGLFAVVLLSGCDYGWSGSLFSSDGPGFAPPPPPPPPQHDTEGGTCTAAMADTIALGEIRDGRLAENDCTLGSGQYADLWRFDLNSPVTVRIDLESSEFDTYLFVTDAAGERIASDDDGGEGLNSRLVLSFEEGEYTLWANSYSSGGRGSYLLSVQPTSTAGAIRTAPGSGEKGPGPNKPNGEEKR